MFVEHVLYTVNAKSAAAGVGKQDVVFAALRLAQPGVKHTPGRFGERGAALAPSLADYPQVSASSEGKIVALESGHLGETESGLNGRQDKRMIASTGPSEPIGSGKKRVHFRTREKADQGARKTLARNG
jgi:hypothetical protein